MPLRIVPEAATEDMAEEAQADLDMPFTPEGRELNPDTAAKRTYHTMLSARPDLTREQVDELTEIFNIGKRHWMKTDKGKYRFNLPKDCLLRMNDRADMLRFLAAAFEQKVEG